MRSPCASQARSYASASHGMDPEPKFTCREAYAAIRLCRPSFAPFVESVPRLKTYKFNLKLLLLLLPSCCSALSFAARYLLVLLIFSHPVNFAIRTMVTVSRPVWWNEPSRTHRASVCIFRLCICCRAHCYRLAKTFGSHSGPRVAGSALRYCSLLGKLSSSKGFFVSKTLA